MLIEEVFCDSCGKRKIRMQTKGGLITSFCGQLIANERLIKEHLSREEANELFVWLSAKNKHSVFKLSKAFGLSYSIAELSDIKFIKDVESAVGCLSCSKEGGLFSNVKLTAA